MRKNKRGFTVIELLAVICVLAILVSLALPRYFGYTQEAKFTRLIHDAKLIEQAATRSYLANGQWPSDTSYTKDQILSFSKTIYDSSGRKVDPISAGNYYDIDFKALGRYITIQSDPKNFILFIPENSDAVVYVLDPTSNTRLTASSSEPQPLRQPVSGEIPIRAPEELAKIGVDPNYPLSSKYILMANLDLSSYSNWNPIGNNTTPFAGTFDGNGLVIKNLTINRPTAGYQGLFGKTDSAAKLMNIGLENVNVTGNYSVGGLVGYNYYGTITNSWSTGSVQGNGNSTGGLVGINNSGIITSSYSTGSVAGYDNTGGLVGNNSGGTIKNSYSTSNVSSSGSNAGGLVGGNHYSSTISNSYAIGSVTSMGRIGGLVGYNYLSTITSSYWDVQTSGIATSAGGTGKTTAEMKQQSTFAGWDFTTVWAIDEGKSYPYLRSNEQIPHPGTSQ